jgi:sortase B
MFGTLSNFLKQSYYENHKYIYFDTPFEYRTYEIIAVFKSHEYEDPMDDNFKYYFFYNADTQEEFDYWYSNIKSMSEIKCSGEGHFGDQFITLSTCNGIDETGKRNPDGRLAVVAVRVE